jgi:hypothetical protein
MIKRYRSLYKRSGEQDVTTAFAHFYAVGGDYDEPWRAIARKTIDGFDAWGFSQDRFKRKYSRSAVPKLKNYLDYTFARLIDMELTTPGVHFFFTEDQDWVTFNTGLQNVHSVDLLAVFQRYKPRPDVPPRPSTDWVYKGCYAANERGYRERFGTLIPEIAYYSLDSRDFVFNTAYHLDKGGFDHLLERGKQRAGMPNAADDAVRNYLRGALEMVVPKIKRNYKVAIPVYYVEEKKMQLLLPFAAVSDPSDVSCFLIDRDDATQSYSVKTIYDLDHAYFAARLITRPDREWLNP